MQTEPRIRAHIAHRLVDLAERLHAWRPRCRCHWRRALGDYVATACAGVLDLAAALVVLATVGR
ncbi:MAG: hypothetical protein ACYDBQ_03555 [Thermoplasmatota archaeon]